MLSPSESSPGLATIAQRARAAYIALLASNRKPAHLPWWDTIILTASSARQADSFRQEINRRLEHGHLPSSARYIVIPDPAGTRVGSGAATLHALLSIEGTKGRILMIHSGGESRRLPQYSFSGKLFSVLPLLSPWGDASTVFDEFLAHSTSWLTTMPPGLLVASGDVLLVFDAGRVAWPASGVHGLAMRQPAEVGARHGVYVLGPDNTVYAYFQKPSQAEVRAAGGELPDSTVAVDTGLLFLDPPAVTCLTAVARPIDWTHPPVIDLYHHFTGILTSQWRPAPGDSAALHHLAGVLRGVPFTASLVEGEFTHVGGTTRFRELMTGEDGLPRLYEAHQKLGASTLPGVRSSGVIIDSVLADAGIGAGTVVIECHLDQPLHAMRGCLLHGLNGLTNSIEVPEDTVVHQVPVRLSDFGRAAVMRIYGVHDDPKESIAGSQGVWFGRPVRETLDVLGLSPEEVWPDIPVAERSLWNASLFPATTPDEAWTCAAWMLGLPSPFDLARWRQLPKFSLGSSTEAADEIAILEARSRRAEARWQSAAVRMALDGVDIRPMLAQAPSLSALSSVAERLCAEAGAAEALDPTGAASRLFQAGLFFTQTGQQEESGDARRRAFSLVSTAVHRGVVASAPAASVDGWRHSGVNVAAAARIDFGGGWSDTPPFCLDWGGTVLNAAVLLNGRHPIQATLRVIPEPVIRCVQTGENTAAIYRTAEELHSPLGPGDPFAIARSVCRISGIFPAGKSLKDVLQRLGGGLEFETAVRLPMGSGLGTSSILAAAVLQSFQTIAGRTLEQQALSDRVLELEQIMSTGGGWQDQAGGIFPGIKLISSGPGSRQRLHQRPLLLSADRIAELESLIVLGWTGITRVARGLLQEVVGRYLARETHALQVLHSIKTLALEMGHAMEQGDWDYLGELLDRHWELNQVLDPNTANAPIRHMLAALRPHLRGAKLAGAGGGGFLILLAKSPESAAALKSMLDGGELLQGAAHYDWRLADSSLTVTPFGRQ